MTLKKSQIGLEVFICALVLGIAGESSLSLNHLGFGATLWTVAIACTSLLLIHRWDVEFSSFDRWMILPLLLLALCYGWRDAGMLKFASTIGIVALLGLGIQARQLKRISKSELKIPGLLSTGLRALWSYPAFLYRDVEWSRLSTTLDIETVRSVVKGIFIAVPCLFVFGILLSSADEGFGDFLGAFLFIDVLSLPARVVFVALLALLTGAYFRGVVTEVKRVKKEDSKNLSLKMLETGIVLGLVNVLFVSFVIMQLGYLFGGIGYIEATSGLTMAQYARRGFFELVTVVALALSVIMILGRFFEPSNSKHKVFFNLLAGIQVGLLLIMLVSAAQRMWLYTASFGLTELRLYTSAFMVWMGFVLGWFVWMSLKEKPLQFVRGSVLAGISVVLMLHLVNPDALIARNNINLAVKNGTLDHRYLSTLSADAVPTIVEMLPLLPPEMQHTLSSQIADRWFASDLDWKTWNLSHHRAKKNALDSQILESRMYPHMNVRTP